jgi:hypothetical protein
VVGLERGLGERERAPGERLGFTCAAGCEQRRGEV